MSYFINFFSFRNVYLQYILLIISAIIRRGNSRLADFSLKIFKAVWAGVSLISKITQSVGLEAVEQPIYSINNVFCGQVIVDSKNTLAWPQLSGS